MPLGALQQILDLHKVNSWSEHLQNDGPGLAPGWGSLLGTEKSVQGAGQENDLMNKQLQEQEIETPPHLHGAWSEEGLPGHVEIQPQPPI